MVITCMHGSLTNFTIAATLAVVFGLGWALGLAATSLPVKELTLTFFALHGVRNQPRHSHALDPVVYKSHLTDLISSTKTSSAGPQSVHTGGTPSGASILPHKRYASVSSTVQDTYSKQPYTS